MMTQYDERNLTMVMDLYELTMTNGFFLNGHLEDIVTFDVFYRHNPDNAGFAIFAGLQQVVEYIEGLHFAADDIAYLRSLNLFDDGFLDYLSDYRFSGDVYAVPEGTIIYPNEPIITVIAKLVDAFIIEAALLAQVNHQSLIATKTNRIVRAAAGRGVSDFGARRAHNMDAAVYGARAAYIGGAGSTATLLAGKMFGIPVSGTMAHSWVMQHSTEFEAFAHYARCYPDACVLLIDTYDVLSSGVPNAVRCAREVLGPMGKRLAGVRIDSGDLAWLSKETRKMLDAAGLQDCIIVGSNSLDEYTITSLLGQQGAKLDSFGVGERLITAKSDPVFGAVYKMVAIGEGKACIPKIKISDSFEKITNPGRKRLFRVLNPDGHAVADLICKEDEQPDLSQPYRYVDPAKPWKHDSFVGCTLRELQQQVIAGGSRCVQLPSLDEIRTYVREQLDNEIWQEEQRFENPHVHYLDMSPAYYAMKMGMLEEAQATDTQAHNSAIGVDGK